MRKNNLVMGVTDFLILYFLEEKDCYVYEIAKGIKESSRGLLDISQQTIYSAMYKLQTEKMVSKYDTIVGKRRRRIYYHLEESGRKYLQELKQNYTVLINAMDYILNSRETGGH